MSGAHNTQRRIVVLHTPVPPDAPQDDQDTLEQVEAVSQALGRLGYEPLTSQFSSDIIGSMQKIEQMQPWMVFNLVETLEGCGRLIHIAPSFLDAEGIAYSGCSAESLLVTTNKTGAKRYLAAAGIPTARSQECEDILAHGLFLRLPVILKSIWEHASSGLDEHSVYRECEELLARIRRMPDDQVDVYFVEEFLEGREFNYALLASENGVESLPPGEILFEDYPPDKPRIVCYKAKWEPQSFEYNHTPRTFDFEPSQTPLLEKMREIALRCWDLFGLRGYARVDFRVTADGTPHVLEINGNPCINPDSGFVAAAEQAGISYDQLVHRILLDSCRKGGVCS